MNHQPDLFGGDESAVRSFPPHLDPVRVADYTVTCDIDRDHIAAPVDGRLPVGALGTNRETYCAQVLDAAGEVLASFPFDTPGAADAKVDELRAALNRNRQMTLL